LEPSDRIATFLGMKSNPLYHSSQRNLGCN
jgi:hypothetical protein